MSASPGGPVRRDQTVAEIGARWPRTQDVLRTSGINHCCGAHLTLAEAAAAAGVDLERLLARLEAAVAP
jgi:iron-sulfur cluster repair protein YtfE (RIC family)